MEIGLFGKLPAKRDYISYGVGRAFLELWEPWVQGAIAASRDTMREGWLPAYMNAPIWRFWLGPALCGSPVAGAVMPSVDGVGRYFPLSLVATGVEMPPPSVDAQEAWFDAAEGLLLDALEDGRPFETTLAALRTLPPPGVPEPRTAEAAFAAIRHAAEPAFHDTLSCWWVRPTPGQPVRAMIRRGMPGPYDYVEMIRPIEPAPLPPPVMEEEPMALTGGHGPGLWDVGDTGTAAPAAAAAPAPGDDDEPMALTGGQAPGVGIWEVGDETAPAPPPPAEHPAEPAAQPAATGGAPPEAPPPEPERPGAAPPESQDPGTQTPEAQPDEDALVLGRNMAVKADV